MKLLIAMPCLNEELTVAEVIQNIPTKIDGITHKEVLIVDDGSNDDTVQKAKSVGATVISHNTNKGVGVALQTAYNYALENDFDVMVNIDADNQFDPNYIPKVIKPIIDKKADMVTASRFIDKSYIPHNMSFIKKYGNIAMSKLISGLCGEKFYDVSCGFRAYSKETLLNLNLHGKFTYTQETFLDLTYKGLVIKEVPVVVKYFEDRKSRVAGSIWKYAIRTSNIIFTVYRDYYPMKFFGFISFLFLVVSMIFGGIFLNHFLETGKFTGYLFAGFISGFSFMISLVLFVVGLAMGMLVRIKANQERILLNLKKKR
jgi:glycosyltransferase involved in cell wall biosynthesis